MPLFLILFYGQTIPASLFIFLVEKEAKMYQVADPGFKKGGCRSNNLHCRRGCILAPSLYSHILRGRLDGRTSNKGLSSIPQAHKNLSSPVPFCLCSVAHSLPSPPPLLSTITVPSWLGQVEGTPGLFLLFSSQAECGARLSQRLQQYVGSLPQHLLPGWQGILRSPGREEGPTHCCPCAWLNLALHRAQVEWGRSGSEAQCPGSVRDTGRGSRGWEREERGGKVQLSTDRKGRGNSYLLWGLKKVPSCCFQDVNDRKGVRPRQCNPPGSTPKRIQEAFASELSATLLYIF